jgi:hypothetical protein
MLIGHSVNNPSLQCVRRLKRALREVLQLPEDAMVTVTQLACLEQDCAPLETVIGLLRPGEPQRQFRLHKPTEAVDAHDLAQVCVAWGVSVQENALTSYFDQEI